MARLHTPYPMPYQWSESHFGQRIDIRPDEWELTFEDDFDTLDTIVPTTRVGKWYAPARSDFGNVILKEPLTDPNVFPFRIENSILTLLARRVSGTTWHGGHCQTISNVTGRGFSQMFGFFECKVKLNPGLNTWSGIWLKSANEYLPGVGVNPTNTIPRTEFDLSEFYGISDETHMHSTLHLWPPNTPDTDETIVSHTQASAVAQGKDSFYPRGASGIAPGWHQLGGLLTPEYMAVYWDRYEVRRITTPPESHQPMFWLLSQVIYSTSTLTTQSPARTEIDWVRTYQRRRGW